jgi:hypothetical protein
VRHNTHKWTHNSLSLEACSTTQEKLNQSINIITEYLENNLWVQVEFMIKKTNKTPRGPQLLNFHQAWQCSLNLLSLIHTSYHTGVSLCKNWNTQTSILIIQKVPASHIDKKIIKILYTYSRSPIYNMSTKALKSSADLDLYKSIRRDKNNYQQMTVKMNHQHCDPQCSPNFDIYLKIVQSNLGSCNVATAWSKWLGKSAHHYIYISRFHAQ